MSTERVASFIVNTGYKDIPQEALDIAKMSLMDGLGVAMAGSREATGRAITGYVKTIGGRPVSSVIGGGFKTAPELAALANGTLAHALDYDDHAVTWMGHPTVVLLPSIFALAESQELDGRRILEAYSVGWEVGSKFASRLSIPFFANGWHPTATIGTLAATAACAKLCRLEKQQTQIALGIAASLASGLRLNFGTDTKPFHAGRAASNAITAVLLARDGFTAQQNILEGPIGFCSAFGGKKLDLDELADQLGSPFDITSSYSIKPYPSCGLTHRCIDAMLQLVKENDITQKDVAEIECFTPPMVRDILLYSRPQTGLHGKFSMEYCMAAAILDKEVSLRQFTDEKVQTPQAQELMSKVRLTFREFPEGKSLLNVPQAVKVKLKNGREHYREVDWPKGYFSNPMTWDEVAEKFRDCTVHSGVLSAEVSENALQLMSKIDSLRSIKELMSIVAKLDH
jgi:2-methylcitrate dehydratase PrpD